MYIVETMDVSVNEVTPIVFCDEEGYDVIPIHMVMVILIMTSDKDEKEQEVGERVQNLVPTQQVTTSLKHLQIQERVSIQGVSEEAKEQECALVDLGVDLNLLIYES